MSRTKINRRPRKGVPKSTKGKITTKLLKKALDNALETAEQKDFLNQMLHPFETIHNVRGPFSGQPTGLYKMTVKQTLSVPASTWIGAIATPYHNGTFLTWSPASTAGNIAAADFTAVAYPAASSVTATYYGVRPLAGGLKVTPTGTPNTVTGTVYAGLLTPGQTVIGAAYSTFLSSPLFRTQHSFTPCEVLYEVDTGVGQVGPEYRGFFSSTVATILSDALVAFPMIFIYGGTAAQTYVFESTFIMEGTPNGLSTGFATYDTSYLTYDDFQRVLMQVPRTVGARFVRSGPAAINDGIGPGIGFGSGPSAAKLASVFKADSQGSIAAAAQYLGPQTAEIAGNMARYAPAYL